MAQPRRVLIAMTSHDTLGDTGKSTGAWLSEVAHPWRVFADADLPVDLVSVKGGKPPLDGVDHTDKIQEDFLNDPVMSEKLKNTPTPDQVNADDYDLIFFAGGHGTMWDFRDNEGLHALARSIYEGGRVVAAVCHGPAALIDLELSDGTKLVAGKNMVAFTNAEEAARHLTDVVPFLLQDALSDSGAHVHPGENFHPKIETDGRLVTGQNPASASGTASAALVVLGEHVWQTTSAS